MSLAYSVSDMFISPLPVWDYWHVLLLPLCLGIAIVYKSIRCDSMRRVPRQALVLFLVIVSVMVAAAAGLAGLMAILER